ncbi:MAG: hypothetical protein IT259_15085 [Saprospiraceae bacterium]|nr:hypothetical protein [Saprospiraceae bacterium]
MARLTTFSRLLITLVIVAAIGFAVKTYLLPTLSNSSSEATPTESKSTPAPAENAPAEEPKTTSAWGKNTGGFNYTPAVPVNGKLKGVAELGATGFNYFIVRIDANKNWKLEKAEFNVSLIKENLATEEDIKEGLRKYISAMFDYGVGPKDIHFVVSSGAAKEPSTGKIIAALKAMKYYVNVVTPLQEAKLAYLAAMPREFQGNGFVVDIGSGNTKIAWMSGNAPTGIELPGAKYYQEDQTDAGVYREVLAKTKLIPSNLRGKCFIIGGVPFSLAKQSRNGLERYTALKAPGDYTGKDVKEKSGLNIYKAVADATGCQQFVFDWDANFTIGFLLSL